MINPYIFLLKYLHDTNNRFFVNLTVEITMVTVKIGILNLKSVYIIIQLIKIFQGI